MSSSGVSGVRLAEVVAALSLASDLGMGLPQEHALRTCLLSLGLGEALGLGSAELADVYYLALLRRIGCTSDSYELGLIFGDDRAAHARVFGLDFGSPVTLVLDVVRHAGAGRTGSRRLQAIVDALAAGPRMPARLFQASCEVAQGLAREFRLGSNVIEALGRTFERWDGKGFPNGIRGEAIALPARIVQVAEDAEVVERIGGRADALAMLQERAGSRHDPKITQRLLERSTEVFGRMQVDSPWNAVLAQEPGSPAHLSEAELDVDLEAVARFADMKSPYTLTHSTGVARLASAAARRGLAPSAVDDARRAALVHDLGRVGIVSAIWDKPGRLTQAEWEHVRLHPYLTERVLSRSPALAHFGALAAQHHERLDRSGYPHRPTPAEVPTTARLLAAADTYCAMTEPRPHRAALAPSRAADALRAEVRAGKLDAAAVDAVLAVAGHSPTRQRVWPAGLTAREVEVLRLLARGVSNRQVAQRLMISEPTVAAHVRHIYDKIGVGTRAGAALFAMQHGLLDLWEPPEK